MQHKQQFYEKQAQTIIQKLNKRNMEAYYCPTSNDAKLKALNLISENAKISWGGSQTIMQIGLLDALKEGNYKLFDRALAKTPEETRQVYLDAFDADYYLMSSNAITLEGELVNIDGNGNRVAALIYGPKNVIVFVGMNKVVVDEDEAIKRIRNQASPPNAIRIGAKTPCSITGKCQDCIGDNTICCQTVITRNSRVANRIKVILVGEELGY